MEETKCLKCGQPFMSKDKKANRICPKCTKDNNRTYSMNSSKLSISNKPITED